MDDGSDLYVMTKFALTEKEFDERFGPKYMEKMKVEGNLVLIGDAKFTCCALGFISMDDESYHVWQWPWSFDENLDTTEIRDVYRRLPEKMQTPDTAKFNDRLGLQLLLAHLCDVGGFDYICKLPLGNVFMPLGIKRSLQ